MPKEFSAMLCGLYALLSLSGCSIAMAMIGDKEPNFEYIKSGATKEVIEFEFNQPGMSKDLGEGKTEVTYKYKMGNSPNAARAAIYGYYDLATLGFAEPVFTVIELFVGHTEETRVVYGPDNKALTISGYSPPPLSPEEKSALEEQDKYIRKRPTPPTEQQSDSQTVDSQKKPNSL